MLRLSQHQDETSKHKDEEKQMLSYKRVGGLRFVRLGPLGFPFWVSRKRG